MEANPDTCPHCAATEYETDHEYLGAYNVRCGECDHVWNLREQLGLSKTTCEVCYRRLSWGCGHEVHHELAHIEHRKSAEHRAGECACFGHQHCSDTCPNHGLRRPGYIPFYDHGQVISGEVTTDEEGNVIEAVKS